MSGIFGLGSILLWQWLTVLMGRLFTPLSSGLFPQPDIGYIFFSLVLCGTFFSLARWGSSMPERWFRIGIWTAAALMSVAWLPQGIRLREIPLVGTLLYLGLPAVGSAMQLAAWEWHLCGRPFPRQALSFGLACTARTGGILLISSLFPSLLPLLAAILPFLSALLWTPPDAIPEAPDRDPARMPGKLTFPPRLAFRVGSFFAASAMFLSILLDRQADPMTLAQEMTDPLYSLGALGAGLFLYRFPELELRKIYFGAEAFLMLGFIAFAALGEGRPLLPLGLLQSGAGIFGAYIFTLLLYLGARAGGPKALPVVAAGQMVITGSVLLGMVLTKAVGLVALREDIPFVLTASLLGIGLLFFSGFFFRDDRNSFAGYDLGDRDEPFVPEGEDILHLKLAKGPLSRQEIRVALFVAQGLSNEEISRQLNITGNTLRTHLRNIHRKMGSSSRKELLDLLLQLER